MRFREIERGWLVQVPDPFDLFRDTVGNVVTNWSGCLDWAQLRDAEEPFDTDSNADYYVERAIVRFALNGIPTALNLTNVIWVWVGLMIVDTNVAQKADIPAGYTLNAFTGNTFRGFEDMHRIVRADLFKVGLTSPPSTTTPDGAVFHGLPSSEPLMFDVAQPIFLQRNQSLAIVASQTGVNDDFQEWVENDTVSILSHCQFLIRKKKGR